MYEVAFNIDLLIDLKLVLVVVLLEFLLNHRVYLGLFGHIWVAHEALLLSIFPHLEVPHFDVFQDNFEREVVGEV